ncbi:vascular endothelial growth factor D-like isoform X2 [Eriocheir sinensis]|uniref:vascular endothelial growth factor D-like isoform X2 n=1 Tax=Eriocheir sinensis TaxID=95602 RepID=UPI0021C94671|nr:vascular endothelial growth factor D-like isoform X2 [Eriocheir sinensis]
MPTFKFLSLGCLVVVMVVAVPGVTAEGPVINPSDNDVYPTSVPPSPHPEFSKARALNVSQTTDLREFIMRFVQDERICSNPTLRDLILGEDGEDKRAQVWWNRRCGGGRRGGAPRFPSAQSPESTLIRYRRKSTNRDNPQNSLDRSRKDKKKWQKVEKLMRDKRVFCNPKKKAVPLPNPDHSTTKLQPECVYIKQCGGCCGSPELECLPTETKTRTFPTMVLTPVRERYNFPASPIRMVKVVEHKKCSCQCKVRAEHCTPSQVYNEGGCQCQCPSHLSRACPARKSWNDKTCRCECTRPRECTTGRYFDVNTCRCLKS